MVMKMMKSIRTKNNKKGFTLIELIVVIAILAILAAIAIPRLGGFTDTAKVSADEANAKMLTNAAAVYQAATGAYPLALSDLLVAKGKYQVSIAAIPIIQSPTYGAVGTTGWNYNTTTGIVGLAAPAATP